MMGLALEDIEIGLVVDLGSYHFTRDNVLPLRASMIRSRSMWTMTLQRAVPSASWRLRAGTPPPAG